jgi:hypothetical protein
MSLYKLSSPKLLRGNSLSLLEETGNNGISWDNIIKFSLPSLKELEKRLQFSSSEVTQ